MRLAAVLFSLLSITLPGAAAPPRPEVLRQIPLPGPVRWDYLTMDEPAHRLYVAHGAQVDVVDTLNEQIVGHLADTHGVHGVAVASELGRVFTSNGADNEIGVFDREDLHRLRSIPSGGNPDAIVYEPVSRRVISFNGRSNDATIADARTGELVVASLPMGGKPEFAVVDGLGLVYVNIEDSAEIVVLDARDAVIVRRYSIAPCQEPTGLDRDVQGRLYSVCGNRLMVISDPALGRVLGQADIGAGADGVVWLDGVAISANGRDGTVSVVGESATGRFSTLATLPVAPGARTIAVDRLRHKLYLPTAEFKPAAPAEPGQKPARRQALPDSMKLFVLSAGG